MYKVLFCYLLFIFCLCGCTHRHNAVDDDVICIAINPEKSKELDMKTTFSSIEVVPLESSAASLFGRCDKMFFFEEKYYILDKKEACIFIFAADGTFLGNSKDKQGSGPGEYYCIVDFDISKDKHIEVLDVLAYKIKKYDDEFNFLGEVDIPKELYPITSFKCLNNEMYAFYSPLSSNTESDKVRVYSFRENRIIDSVNGYITNAYLKVGATQPYSFYEFDGDVFFSFPYSNDKLYRIDGNEGYISEKIYYDFGDYSFPFRNINSHISVFEDIITGSKKYVFPIYRGENKRFLFTFAMYQEKQYLLLYEKVSKQVHFYSCTFHDGKMLIPPAFIDNDFLYIVAEQGWLEFLIDRNLQVGDMENSLKDNQEEDNPVILRYCLLK